MNKPIHFALNRKILSIAFLFIVLLIGELNYTMAASEPSLEWSKTYGSYEAQRIIQTSDGGFAFIGLSATHSIRGYDDYKSILVKISAYGELEWSQDLSTYSHRYADRFTDLIQTSDAGFLLCNNKYIVRTDAQGNTIWSNNCSFKYGAYGLLTSEGDIIVVGSTSLQVDYRTDTLLLKYNGDGKLLWEKDFIANESTIGLVITATNDSNYIIAGDLGNKFWCTKVDPNGNMIWNNTYYYNKIGASYEIQSVANTNDGGYILAGPDGTNGWLIKIDNAGNEQWHQKYELANYRSGEFLFTSYPLNDGYIIFGYSNLLKTDSSGNLQWSISFNDTVKPAAVSSSESYTYANNGIVTSNGDYVVTGSIDNGLDYIWVARYSSSLISVLFTGTTLVYTVVLVIVIIVFAIGASIYYRKNRYNLKTDPK